MFQPRFVPLILDGTKTSTIRLPRKREVRVGDICDLRTWTGRPYASKQRKLREVVCAAVLSVEIDESWEVWLHGNKRLEIKERRALARGEGFYSPMDMLTWFRDTHGMPFRGTLYRWKEGLA
ncbi:ASCH domain-containing protein [Termitidicoccus mucosus]|uniref:ASCH domain-containing protein n=1 Tax=Termitidicoccus mucosus TaxID=1184151 RepID=A0A178IJA8_9BACT|nr:hypothetical protein AW736_13725 [Opitutaceae bacterium TSB47]